MTQVATDEASLLQHLFAKNHNRWRKSWSACCSIAVLLYNTDIDMNHDLLGCRAGA